MTNPEMLVASLGEDVIDALISERQYQDQVWGDTPSIDAYAAYVQSYTNKLIEECARTTDPTEKLNIMRKIGGLAVACMQQHGAPKREPAGPKLYENAYYCKSKTPASENEGGYATACFVSLAGDYVMEAEVIYEGPDESVFDDLIVGCYYDSDGEEVLPV